MATKPEVSIPLNTGTLKIWRERDKQIIFAVIRGNTDVLRGSIIVKNGEAEFFIGSANHTRTMKAEQFIREAVPEIKKHLKSKFRKLVWKRRIKSNYGFQIMNRKTICRSHRK